jgi:hypothetical protein
MEYRPKQPTRRAAAGAGARLKAPPVGYKVIERDCVLVRQPDRNHDAL